MNQKLWPAVIAAWTGSVGLFVGALLLSSCQKSLQLSNADAMTVLKENLGEEVTLARFFLDGGGTQLKASIAALQRDGLISKSSSSPAASIDGSSQPLETYYVFDNSDGSSAYHICSIWARYVPVEVSEVLIDSASNTALVRFAEEAMPANELAKRIDEIIRSHPPHKFRIPPVPDSMKKDPRSAPFGSRRERQVTLKKYDKGWRVVDGSLTAPIPAPLGHAPNLRRPEVGQTKPVIGSRPGEARLFDIGGNVMMEFCWIPQGSFRMGSPAEESPRYETEDQVDVTISRGFWLAKYECTQEQWHARMDSKPSRNIGMDKPVDSVSWDDCRKFVDEIPSPAGGWRFDLPTEAQWEYACRASTKGPFSLPAERVCWYSGNSQGPTHPVGMLEPNGWGLFDMHGNVQEWCRDVYIPILPGGRDPLIPRAEDGSRCRRGGDVSDDLEFCRSAYRSGIDQNFRHGYTGLRVALVPEGDASPPPPDQLRELRNRCQELKNAREAKAESERQEYYSMLTDQMLAEAMATDAQVIERGESVYTTHCIACHGSDLSATMKVNNSSIPLPGVPLNDDDWKYSAKPLEILRFICKGTPDGQPGHNGAKCQAWEKLLQPEQIVDVTVFILSDRN